MMLSASILSTSIFTGLAYSTAGAVIYHILWPIIKIKIRKTVKHQVADFPNYLDRIIKDANTRETITKQIFLAQKYMASESGAKRLEWVKDRVRSRCPDIVETYIIDLIQILYDEFTQEKVAAE